MLLINRTRFKELLIEKSNQKRLKGFKQIKRFQTVVFEVEVFEIETNAIANVVEMTNAVEMSVKIWVY